MLELFYRNGFFGRFVAVTVKYSKEQRAMTKVADFVLLILYTDTSL